MQRNFDLVVRSILEDRAFISRVRIGLLPNPHFYTVYCTNISVQTSHEFGRSDFLAAELGEHYTKAVIHPCREPFHPGEHLQNLISYVATVYQGVFPNTILYWFFFPHSLPDQRKRFYNIILTSCIAVSLVRVTLISSTEQCFQHI
jgi:hypothetical protein